MVLFRPSSFFDISLPVLDGEGVFLRAPKIDDYEAWSHLREASRAFLTPYEPVWGMDDLSRPSFRRRLRSYAQDVREDNAYPFLIFRYDDQKLVGGLTLANVRRGVAQSISLGYWIGQEFARQGYMTQAVRAVVPYVFERLNLRRLEAACIPSNEASIRLLEKTGFSREGYARQYLCIQGVWQDHLLYALLKDDGLRV